MVEGVWARFVCLFVCFLRGGGEEGVESKEGGVEPRSTHDGR